MASYEGNSNTGESSPSALFTKFGGAFFGAASGSPQKVVTNIRGFLSNKLPSNISIPSVSDTGKHATGFLMYSYLLLCHILFERKKYCINYTFVPFSYLIFLTWKSQNDFCESPLEIFLYKKFSIKFFIKNLKFKLVLLLFVKNDFFKSKKFLLKSFW